jgi:hypothetical protein
MTVGSPPSITATTEFVVPRSMPMILLMREILLKDRLSALGFRLSTFVEPSGELKAKSQKLSECLLL